MYPSQNWCLTDAGLRVKRLKELSSSAELVLVLFLTNNSDKNVYDVVWVFLFRWTDRMLLHATLALTSSDGENFEWVLQDNLARFIGAQQVLLI